MSDRSCEEPGSYPDDALPLEGALRRPGMIAEASLVRGKLLALARALARLAAREDAANEEKVERARIRQAAATETSEEI